jgi:hypothetical protein
MNNPALSSLFPTRLAVIFWLATLIIAGAYLRLRGIGDYYYSLDEMCYILMAKAKTIKQVIDFSRYETHPFYPNILRHYWLQISDALWFTRGMSILFGLACIISYYAIGKEIGGALTGCIAAYLITFGYGNIIQSQVARDYSVLALFLSLAYYFYHIFLRSSNARYLIGYAIFALLSLMTHYSAVIMLYCIGLTGCIVIYRRLGLQKLLWLWLAVNALVALYFGYIYIIEIQHNAYEELFLYNTKIASTSPEYNNITFRTQLFFAYIFATISYFFHAGYDRPLNIPSVFIFIFSLVWLCKATSKYFILYETIIALLLGASLVTANIYPYSFIVGGRHAFWIMPFIILPVSLCGADVIRHLATKIHFPKIIAGFAIIALGAGVLLNPMSSFQDDLREYQLSKNQEENLKTFLLGLTTKDLIITTGLNVLYLLPDETNYYRTLNNANKEAWYYLANRGNTRIIYTKHSPLIMNGEQISLGHFMRILEKQGELKNINIFWLFSTYTGQNTSKPSICNMMPKKIISFRKNSANNSINDKVMAEFVGISRDTLIKDIIPENGKYADCL